MIGFLFLSQSNSIWLFDKKELFSTLKLMAMGFIDGVDPPQWFLIETAVLALLLQQEVFFNRHDFFRSSYPLMSHQRYFLSEIH